MLRNKSKIKEKCDFLLVIYIIIALWQNYDSFKNRVRHFLGIYVPQGIFFYINVYTLLSNFNSDGNMTNFFIGRTSLPLTKNTFIHVINDKTTKLNILWVL